MRRALTIIGLVVLAVALWAATAVAGHESLSVLLPGNPLEGSRLFSGKGCLSCHAVHSAGGTAGPDFGRGTLNRPLLEIGAAMWNHAPGMEHVFHERGLVRPTFEPGEMANLLAFLYYLGSLDPPGNAESGAALFRQKGCQGCHSVGGVGARLGPPLDKYSRYVSPLFLTAALWNRGRAMAAVMEARKVPRPTFEGRDIPDLVAYIRSAGGGTERVYAPPGSPKRGEEIFARKRCLECHAVRGHGSKVGPDLGLEVKGSLMQIAGQLWNHGPGMWSKMAERGIQVPSLTTEELSDLVSYLYFFQFIDPPGNPARGAAVYAEKRCGTCHGSGGSPSAAPPLTVVMEQLRTPVAVVTAMWNHAGRMTEAMVEENVAWPVLKGGEMADLVAYFLRDRGAPEPSPGRPGPRATTGKPKR